MFAKAYPEIPQEESEGLLIDKYLERLEDMDGRKHVNLKEPATLDQAIATVAQYEAITTEIYTPRKPQNWDASQKYRVCINFRSG